MYQHSRGNGCLFVLLIIIFVGPLLLLRMIFKGWQDFFSENSDPASKNWWFATNIGIIVLLVFVILILMKVNL